MDFNIKLETALKQSEKFCDTDGELLKQKVKSLALSFDEDLIEILLNNNDTKKHFFKNISGATIFDYRRFIDFIDDKNFLLDSYTKFSNKIGLTISDKHIKQIDNVVLTFPFKDCILEGGQSKEDESRKEIFFNETLAKDEISRLLDKKVIANATKYYYENETVQETEDFTFTRDKEINKKRGLSEDTITDNLIIKGNNLLALHSLKSNFAGKVKLIYIDPPYNTGNDGFKYNDSFNHSTWLTFMKNRLEIARDLLTEDGVIFVQCDDNEQAYLKVLMDEIFGNKNFISTVVNVVKPEGRRYGFIAQAHDYLLVYGKDISSTDMYEMTNHDKKLPYKDNKGKFDIVGLRNRAVKFFNSSNRPNLYYPFYVDTNNTDNDGFMVVSIKPIKGYTEVLPIVVDNLQSVWRWGKEKAKTQSDEVVARVGNDGSIRIFKKDYSQTTMPTTFWKDKELITQKGTQQLDKLFNAKVFAFPKPEALLERIIEISTKKNDIVLDYHLGSGTTCSVAHKMGRKYIGIEQMNYIRTVAVERVKKVIDGDQAGISENAKWKSGGEFIYFELDKYNQKFIDKLSEATEENILDIYKEITEKGFLNYDVELHKIEEHFEEFKAFSLEEKQEFLISILNKNMLYKNLSEIDDSEYEVDSKTKTINADFYNLSKSGKWVFYSIV